jgi:hypothetical protein
MKALLETLGDLGNPKPNESFSPKWKRSDYIALAILALVLAMVYGFWPQDWKLPQ